MKRERNIRVNDRVSIIPYVISNHVKNPIDGILFRGLVFKGVIKKFAFKFDGTSKEYTFVCAATDDQKTLSNTISSKLTRGVFNLDIPVKDGEEITISCLDESISECSISFYIESEHKIKVGR